MGHPKLWDDPKLKYKGAPPAKEFKVKVAKRRIKE
jgi:hypothetical protein